MTNSPTHQDPLVPYQTELAQLIENNTDGDGIHPTVIPALSMIRNSVTTFPSFSVHEPTICFVAQGTKVVILGDESYTYGPSSYLVVSLVLPVSAQIIQATPDSPYLCVQLKFDPKDVLDLMNGMDQPVPAKGDSQRALFVAKARFPLLDAVIRLVRLLDNPEDVPVLSPLIIREILYRLLSGGQSNALIQIAMSGSSSNRIANVVQRIKQNYTIPLRIEELASIANMAPSTLHRHFKEVTAMSPLQYQKQLQLQEARRILLSESADAADVAFQVGYESPSQFSREYARLFGLPPISDINRLRRE
ncbi:AraC family transcriptional regulator [Paenibacillus psychroresistens]|uniref:AraC family transcriptional regulator n=1 Tax=Paenibacillus psychroresistens TaxID=1778678 RepID=A0A6B8RQI3_9BACL|nr:AraC family transcriptional regulator [Paenibacillus psychroresistens]QGQ97646.1 AraC family transcriptional regulator [Paenibacillus psychroresistens]